MVKQNDLSFILRRPSFEENRDKFVLLVHVDSETAAEFVKVKSVSGEKFRDKWDEVA
jgi:hypothetical protein